SPSVPENEYVFKAFRVVSELGGRRNFLDDHERFWPCRTDRRRKGARPLAMGNCRRLYPRRKTGPEPEMLSHETACILNAGNRDAHVKISIYFSDHEPLGPYVINVPAQRTKHLRFNDLLNPELPRGTDYSSVIESDVPIVVQHTRLDSRQAANALLSTIAFASD